MKTKKGCKICGVKAGEHHLIGCPVEENSYVKVPPIEKVKPVFIDFKIKE